MNVTINPVALRRAAFLITLGVMAAGAHGGVLGTALASTGQTTPGADGALVTLVNDPFTTTDGRVAFTGGIADGLGGTTNFVWFDGQIVWLDTQALPTILSGAESTMGIGDAGQWIYSPSEDGFDAVWSDGASLLKEEDPAPGFEDQFISFCSRPQMNADGTPTWISGITFPQGGGTIYRALYAGGVPVIFAGTIVDGESIANAGGLGFAYDFSRNGAQFIVKAQIDAPGTSNDVFVVGDTIAAREGNPTGEGDNWQNFGECKINNAGDYVFSGDTSGPAASDGYVARNGVILLREGSAIAGLGNLTGNPSAVAINDVGQVGFIWNSSGGEALVVATPDAAGGLAPQVLLKVGDPVDLDGDGIADGTVSDFNAATVVAPGLDLPTKCQACANVDVVPVAGGEVQAVVCVPLPGAPALYDLNQDGVVDGADLGILLTQFGGPGSADFDCSGIVDGADLGALLAAWSGA